MADLEDKDNLIAKFASVAGVDSERARFYLESAQWNLDVAMASFYDEDADEDNEAAMQSLQQHEPKQTDTALQHPSQPARTGATAQSRFATLGNVHSDDSSDEEGQAYYAGGSERGAGQQIIGPPKKKGDADNFIQQMFSAARQHGAEVVDPTGGPGEDQPQSVFQGRAYRLGATEGKSEIVGASIQQPTNGKVNMILKLWKNGFSVDDGELRDYTDPQNMEFLDSVKRGEIPRELIRQAQGGEVDLNMEDHRHEDFGRSKQPMKSFSGEGHRLGSTVAPVVTSPPTAAGGAANTAQTEEKARTELGYRSDQPSTNIQVRLVDGSRLVSKFNHSHTVGDIRRYIAIMRPEYAATNFSLMTTFPNKELSDDSLTLDTGKLLNAVIVQRMK